MVRGQCQVMERECGFYKRVDRAGKARGARRERRVEKRDWAAVGCLISPLEELIRKTPSSVMRLYSRWLMGLECPWHTSGAFGVAILTA